MKSASKLSSIDSHKEMKKSSSMPLSSSINLKVGALQAISLDSSQKIAVVAYSSSLKLIDIQDQSQGHQLVDVDTIDMKAAAYLNTQGGFTLSDVSWNKLKINKIGASSTNGDIFVVDMESSKPKADTIKMFQWFSGSSSPPSNSTAGGSTSSSTSPVSSSSYGATQSSSEFRNPSKLRFSRSSPFFASSSQDRAVNKISWSPHNSDLIAGACQDGTVKIYDCRTKPSSSDGNRCISVFDPRANSARDVQFNPLRDHSIAAIFENGCWCVWDTRTASKALFKVPGHTSNGYALAWHASHDSLLATGSRDKIIKIWNLKSMNSNNTSSTSIDSEFMKPEFMIQTSSPVGSLRWRPGRQGRHHLASASPDRGDISIWSAPLMMVPDCILRGRADACSGFEWLNLSDSSDPSSKGNDGYDAIISIGKDGKVLLQSMSAGFYPRRHIASHVTAISSLGHCVIQRGKSISMPSSSSSPSKAIAVDNGVVSLGLADISLSTLRDASKVRLCRPVRAEGNVFDPAMLHLLAQSYHTGWEGHPVNTESHTKQGGGMEKKVMPFIAVCKHNQSVAHAAGLRCRAAVWAAALAVIPNTIYTPPVPPPSSSSSSSSSSLSSSSSALQSSIPFARDMLGDLLQDLLEGGDCLHFVFLSEILRHAGLLEHVTRDRIPEIRQRETYLSLIDLLMRQQLYAIASLLVKVSSDPYIKTMGSGGVTIHTACSHCSKEVPENVRTPWCARCRSCLSLCSVCQQPTRGLYMMCPVCAHGGHKECMEGWFARSTSCPTGCEHHCCEAINTLGNSSAHGHMHPVSIIPSTTSPMNDDDDGDDDSN